MSRHGVAGDQDLDDASDPRELVTRPLEPVALPLAEAAGERLVSGAQIDEQGARPLQHGQGQTRPQQAESQGGRRSSQGASGHRARRR